MKALFFILTFMTWTKNVWAQMGDVDGPRKRHVVLIDLRPTNYYITGIEVKPNDKATIASNMIATAGLHYEWRALNWVRFIFNYHSSNYTFKDSKNQLDPSKDTLAIAETSGALWLKSGRKSSFTFGVTQKDEIYYTINDDKLLEFTKEKMTFSTVQLEQIIIGEREGGAGFRFHGDLKADSSKLINRKGYGVEFFFHIEWEKTVFDIYGGASQVTKDTKDEVYTFTDKAMYGGLSFGWSF